MIQDWINFD